MTMKKKIRAVFEMYITRKIGAEIKCCLTFMLILCYYGVYRLYCGFETAELIHMLEMLWAAYILEWIQVLPQYRGKKIGQLIVTELLFRMKDVADFATVSGKVDNETNPEALYRKCGFVGNDLWHILISCASA